MLFSAFIIIFVVLLFFNFFYVKLINNVVIVSGVQQRESVIHIHVATPFQVLFPFGLSP